MSFRYNIDGTRREETEQERAADEQDRRRRLNRGSGEGPRIAPYSRQEALQFASKVPQYAQHQSPWSRETDRALFQGTIEIPFRNRHAPEFDEFVEFYIKYLTLRNTKTLSELASSEKNCASVAAFALETEWTIVKNALKLFEDYSKKKKGQLEEKIKKDRMSLPIWPFKEQIADAVKSNRVVLIAADTGAGKSTQVPQYIIEAGFDKIACTQPRRIACYSLARRVSYESLDVYGSEIAYQVRFEGTKTEKTRILFLTEGLLLRQATADPKLSMYSVVIVDEVHERHVTCDFLLGVLKRLLAIRQDLRVVLMSATINAKLFSEYFDAPVIEIPGRMYPVSIHYLPNEKEDRNVVDEKLFAERSRSVIKQSILSKGGKISAAPYLQIMERIDQTVPESERGDLLVFISGMQEITTLAEELRNYAQHTKKWIVLMLHSTLSVAEQEKVFDIAPPGVRKCILSTNIAETSVTIDGIRFIIDSGKVKEMGYEASTSVSKLAEYWIAKSSAKQRAGRAGRTGPGECFRFYSKNEYEKLNEFPVPEILRTSLESVVLQIRAYGLGNPRHFDFIESPPEENIVHSITRLQDLRALDVQENITPLGRVLAVLPVDVVIGKLMVLGTISDLLNPTLILAAALSVPSPLARVDESKTAIVRNRNALMSEDGDPFTLLNLYTEWLQIKARKQESTRNWCLRRGVEEQRLYEMVKLEKQFEEVLNENLRRGSDDDGDDENDSQRESNNEDEDSGNVRLGKRSRDGRGGREDPAWNDPEARLRRRQRAILERQKREQGAGKRKVLKLETDDNIDYGNDVDESLPVSDIAAGSINELEFALKHDPKHLLEKSSVASLTNRDIAVLKLILCSGLYPQLAIRDDANAHKRATEHVFHTKTKRFIFMHPSSVFAVHPEFLLPMGEGPKLPPTAPGGFDRMRSVTADSKTPELLCFVELLQTTKPFLTNVFRVPAVSACLLFARSMHVSWNHLHVVIDGWLHLSFPNREMAEKCLILSSWLRAAWDLVIWQRLERVPANLTKTEEASRDTSEITIGTIVQDDSNGSDYAEEDKKGKNRRKRYLELNHFEFIPSCMMRIREDWINGWLKRGNIASDFQDLEPEDIMDRLGQFLDIEFNGLVERLRPQDLPSYFGYDPYNSCQSSHVDVTPHIRYFFAEPPPLLSSTLKSLLEIPDESDIEVQPKVDKRVVRSNGGDGKKNSSKSIDAGPTSQQGGSRLRFECNSCGSVLLLTPVEILRHRASSSQIGEAQQYSEMLGSHGPLSDEAAASMNLQSLCLQLPKGMHFKDILKGFFGFEYRRIKMFQADDGSLNAYVLFKDHPRAKEVKDRIAQQSPRIIVQWPMEGDFLPRESFYNKPSNPTHILEFILPEPLPKDEWILVLTHCWHATIISDPRPFPDGDLKHRVYAEFASIEDASNCHYYVNTKTLIRANIISQRNGASSRRPSSSAPSPTLIAVAPLCTPQPQLYTPNYDFSIPSHVGSRKRKLWSPPPSRNYENFRIVERVDRQFDMPPPAAVRRRKSISPRKSLSPRRSPPPRHSSPPHITSPPLPQRLEYSINSAPATVTRDSIGITIPSATPDSMYSLHGNDFSSAGSNSNNTNNSGTPFDASIVLDNIPQQLIKPLFQQFINTMMTNMQAPVAPPAPAHQHAETFLNNMNLIHTPPKQPASSSLPPTLPPPEASEFKSKYWPSPGIPTNILYIMGIPDGYEIDKIWAPYQPKHIHLRTSRSRRDTYVFAEFKTVDEVRIVLWHSVGLEADGKPILTGYGKLNE
ncbi:hypothetical protein SeLEV6574_g02520 [Synchytrium endobioticum]|uniref:RNA helicase n=1 Tax=Synchytrium endobioticum TaxID=286115 RepID=A0A507DA71_9FUNG|nr:hypothetical protein SeLEV6574_g02520 [Synchytrium endobioticum]